MTTAPHRALEHGDKPGRPKASTLVLLQRPLRPDTDPTSMSRFADDTWHLDQGIFEESAKTTRLNFLQVPRPLRLAAKHYVWVLINIDPPMRLRRTSASRPSLYGVKMFWFALRVFLDWLHEHHISEFCEVTPEILEEYLAFLVDRGDTLEQTYRCVAEVRRLWGYRTALAASLRLPEIPPWGGESAGVLLGRTRPVMENLTPRINEDTMSALLLWALRFVEDFADDIIAAQTEFRFLHSRGARATRGYGKPGPRLPRGGPVLAVEAYANSVRHKGDSLPGRITAAGTRSIDFAHVGKLLGIPLLATASYAHAQRALAYAGLPVDDDAYLATPVAATIGERLWHPGRFSYHQNRHLVRHLHTACLIVVAYLSGARPAEILNLRRGCIEFDATHDLYLMSGVYFKNAVDEAGNKVPAGLPRRDPWVVAQPVAHAVGLLERLHDEDLLFTHRTDPSRIYVTRRSGGAARNSQVVGDDIHRFVAFVDRLCAHHGIDPIPPDPHGLLTITRFRRTLAWFIRRRPRGLVAASIQYGHVHTRMIQGYAGAYDSGFPDELAFEDFLARLEQFAADEHALGGGEHVSGPAAQGYRQRVHAANHRFAGHVLTTKRQSRDLLANPLLQVFHGEAMTCVFDPNTAACQLRGDRDDTQATPDLDDCRPGCRNIARTDRDVAAIRTHRDRLAASVNDRTAPPFRYERERRELDRIDTVIREHDARR